MSWLGQLLSPDALMLALPPSRLTPSGAQMMLRHVATWRSVPLPSRLLPSDRRPSASPARLPVCCGHGARWASIVLDSRQLAGSSAPPTALFHSLIYLRPGSLFTCSATLALTGSSQSFIVGHPPVSSCLISPHLIRSSLSHPFSCPPSCHNRYPHTPPRC